MRMSPNLGREADSGIRFLLEIVRGRYRRKQGFLEGT
jgi:hypothetical protein